MIDNRPKRPHSRKKPLPIAPEPAAPVEIHTAAPAPIEAPKPAPTPVRARSATPPLGGLGGLGNLGGLVSGIMGGGAGSILPVVLAVSALQRNNGARRPPARPAALPAIPADAVAPHSAQDISRPKGVSGLRALSPAAPQESQPAAADPPPAAPVRRAAPARPSPNSRDVKNLLDDLSGYLPGAGNFHASRVSKIIGIADELKSLGNDGGGMFAASTPVNVNTLDRHIGLLNTLSRNIPGSGASNLSKASQVLSLVNTISGGGGLGGGGLGGIANVANMANMSGMLRNVMGSAPAPETKNVTPAQAEGIKDTVNRLLSGMDDKQKSELLDKAKSFLQK